MSVLERLSTEYLTVRNPIFAIYDNAVTSGPSDDTHDIGYYGTYWNGTDVIYSGLYRDSSAQLYRLFDNLTVAPDVYNGLINESGLGFTHASLQVLNLTTSGFIDCLSTINSTSPTTGSIKTAGGLGVALNTFLGGLLNVVSTITSQSTVNSTSSTTGSITTSGGLGVALDTFIGGLLNVTSTITSQSTVNSTSSTTGSIKTAGGLGVALDTFLGGLLNVTGNFTVNGAVSNVNSPSSFLWDNIIPNNIAPYASMKEDNGFAGQRKPDRVIANDTPKIPTIALTTNYTANATTITINALAVGSGYYVGWYLRDDAKSTVAKIITDTDNTGNHTFILDQGFPDAGTAGTNTYSLYNGRYAGWIWDESLTEISAYKFPREDLMNILDPSATDGSQPDYADVSVNNLNVNGSLTVSGGITASPNPTPTMTLTTTHTLTLTEVTEHSIVYVNAASAVTITLPLLSSLNLVNYAYRITVINVTSNQVTLAGNGSNQVEGKASYKLKNQWDKQTVITTPFSTNWVIE
jgi:hypothetical protein